MSTAAVLAMAAIVTSGASHSAFSDAADLVKSDPRFHPKNQGIRFLTCVDCGHGGGTLLNTERDGVKAKVHKTGHCVKEFRRA